MQTAQIGATPKGGICRLTLTDLDRQVRDWFKAQCETLGCTVTVDEVGNMFARRPGKNPTLAPIAMGSHLDTQPTGGKFDGVLGVLGALEAMRTLHETGYETNAPIEIVNWTNEEGSRFAPAMLASGVFAGVFTPDYAYSRADRDGKTFGDEIAAHRLQGRGKSRRAQIRRDVRTAHRTRPDPRSRRPHDRRRSRACRACAGTKSPSPGRRRIPARRRCALRKNALIGAARMIERIDAIAREHAPDAVGAVGLIENKPNSRNVVPGEVFFTVDFRHPEEKVLDAMEAKFRAALAEVMPPLQLTYTETRIWQSPPVKFAPELIECVRIGAEKAGFKSRDMISGAGHDAAYIARVAPTTMIFVPCAGGISHNEAESTSFDECAAGAQVLLNAVLEFDRRLG